LDAIAEGTSIKKGGVIMIATTLTLTGGWAIFAIVCIIYFITNIVYGFGLLIEKKIKQKNKE
jgi:hypothetical protein